MNGRMYDPRLGRFLSPDPIVGDPTSSRSWNLYSYVRNNPLSYVDPTGETELEVIVVTASRCDWVCWEDHSLLVGMVVLASNGSWIHSWDISPWDSDSRCYGYPLEKSCAPTRKTRSTRHWTDSVADQPMDQELDQLGPRRALGFDNGLLRQHRRAVETGIGKDRMKYNPEDGFAAGAVQDKRTILSGNSGHSRRKSPQLVGQNVARRWAFLRRSTGRPSIWPRR